ncbi:eCIS core domain-containing protein [Thermomonospora amylolytica]|uniref:eCIS core domain-containing protein n=1 Tax=Thermomonospora amylolytica TaxID=1411117 RepID=UPI0018E4F8F8|nr:DUF4157 domain-containing protein [Thermomonospora amylolytica]
MDDPLERAADRIADQILGAREPLPTPMPEPGVASRAVADHRPLPSASESLGHVLSGPGHPIEPRTRRFFESRFGRDFSSVRVHTDERAAESARSVGALAYTMGAHIVFGAGRYVPESHSGRRLLAHELAHVVQQRSGGPALMRTPIFTSTMEICHRVLESRHFHVSEGSIVVTANALRGEGDGPQAGGFAVCGEPVYHITVCADQWGPDPEYGTCDFPQGRPVTLAWGDLPEGDYYLVIWVKEARPDCCLRGSVIVEQQRGLTGPTCTRQPPGTMEKLHDALALAGMIPGVGVFADAADAGIYLVQGDWASAGLSVAFMVPALGDMAAAARHGGKAIVRVTAKGVEQVGEKEIARRLVEAKGRMRAAEEAAEEAGGALRRPHGPEPPHARVRVPGLPGCRASSLVCPINYLYSEFPELFKERRRSFFAPYLREELNLDLRMGRSLRQEKKILTGDAMYAEFLRKVPVREWSEPFYEAMSRGRTRPLPGGPGGMRKWSVDDLGSPWVVHHDPPLSWVDFEDPRLWHPMPYRIHDEAHKWWTRLSRTVKARIPKDRRLEFLDDILDVSDL